jgi:pimeloyl-ACP methyl ester carboxylesterase
MQRITTVEVEAPSAQKAVPRRRKVLLFTAIALIAIPLFVISHSKEKTMQSLGENRVAISRDGTRIAFTRLGSGPPVVLVDGAFCYRENGPAPELAPLLAQHFTVFAYDRRGRGESSDTSPYSIALEVDDLRAIVQEAGESAFVVGISSGGALALQAAASGVKMKKLALYEPPYIDEDGKPRSLDGLKQHLQQLITNDDRAGAVKFFMTDVFGAPRVFVFAMPFLMRSSWKKNELVAHTLPYDLTILSDRSVLEERSASIAIPTLVIGGEKSPKELRDAVATVAKALPDGRSQILAGQTHMISAPVLAPVLTEFFAAR